MSDNVVKFRFGVSRRVHAWKPRWSKNGTPEERATEGEVRNGPNLQRLLFRSSRLIAESGEADLIRDVGLDIDRAQTKLGRIKQRLKGVQEQGAAQVQLLTTAETKLAAAIVAALLSGQR